MMSQLNIPPLQLMGTSHNPTDECALNRIYKKDESGDRDRGLVQWFVNLAQENLRNCSPENLLQWQEEIVALQRNYYHFTNPPTPSSSQIKKLQKEVLKHLVNIIDRGQSQFGPFHNFSWVLDTKRVASFTGQPSLPQIHKVFSWDTLKMSNPKQSMRQCLVHFLNQLVKRFASSIYRCPNCSKIFLQFRKHQVYCHRTCQSVAAARNYRQTPPDRIGKRGRPPLSTKKTQPPTQKHSKGERRRRDKRHEAAKSQRVPKGAKI